MTTPTDKRKTVIQTHSRNKYEIFFKPTDIVKKINTHVAKTDMYISFSSYIKTAAIVFTG